MALLTPESVYRRYEVDGVPDSGPHDPVKAEIIQLLNQLFGTSRGGWVVARTLAELNGITPESETDGGVVLTGPGAGYYDRNAGTWVFGRGFPDTFARVTLSGSGTAQTGAVNAGVNPASIEVFFAKVVTPNTAALTLSISGEAAKPVVNLAGNPLSAGEWTGMVMFFLNGADQYQLLIDAGAAASAAQSATNAAASAAAAAAFGTVNFDNVADLLADNNDVIGYSGSDASVIVAAGFRLTAQGFRYEVAASGASDQHVTTAGGVKLYALARQGPTYQTLAELAAQEQPGPTKNLRALAFDNSGVPGSEVDLVDAGTSDPSSTGQVEVEVGGVNHFYTRSNKVHRPQQHGVKTGGVAAANRAGLIEMFSLANETGHEIDMGDANDIYEISDGLDHYWTKKPIIRGSGAKVRLAASIATPPIFGIRFLLDNLGVDIEGFEVDGNFKTPNPFWIENYATTYVEGTTGDVRMVGIGGSNGYRLTSDDFAGRGLNVRGWFRHLKAEDIFCREMKMAAGAGVSQVSGIMGIFIGRDTNNAYPLYKDITNPIVGKIWSEDASYTDDMDAIGIFDHLPTSTLTRRKGTTSIRGGHLKDFWGRGIKLQSSHNDIVGTKFELSSAPTGGRAKSCVDFQNGDGRIAGASLFCNGASVVNGVAGTSRSYTNGSMTVESFSVDGVGVVPDIGALVLKFGDSSHEIGSLTVKDCNTQHVAVGCIADFTSRVNTEVCNVTGNMLRSMSAGAVGARLTGAGSNTINLFFRSNANLAGSGRAAYAATSAIASVVGGASDNRYFTDV